MLFVPVVWSLSFDYSPTRFPAFFGHRSRRKRAASLSCFSDIFKRKSGSGRCRFKKVVGASAESKTHHGHALQTGANKILVVRNPMSRLNLASIKW
jgi:hypothetical protein